jgi:hypothetical protein
LPPGDSPIAVNNDDDDDDDNNNIIIIHFMASSLCQRSGCMQVHVRLVWGTTR